MPFIQARVKLTNGNGNVVTRDSSVLNVNTGGEFECNVAQGMETYGISYLNTEGLYKKHGVNTDDQNQPS